MRRRKLGRVERLERHAGVAALREHDDGEQQHRRHARRTEDQLRARREADVEERKHEQRGEEDQEAREPARMPTRVRGQQGRHRDGPDCEDERDADGERGSVQPPADESAARIEPARDVRVDAAGARHPRREPDDHRSETQAPDTRDDVGPGRGGTGAAGGGGGRRRDAQGQGQESDRLRERVRPPEDPVPQFACRPVPRRSGRNGFGHVPTPFVSREATRKCAPARRWHRAP